MSSELSQRLRDLRDRQNWTVAEMAERTGLPKKTLDKYMLRTGGSLPGFDALISLSRGLGVSLDWLVLGTEFAGEGVELLVMKAAAETSQPYFETILRSHLEGKVPIFDGELILGLSPEEWAADLAARTGDRAKQMASGGVTKEELLVWQATLHARWREWIGRKIDRLKAEAAKAGS